MDEVEKTILELKARLSKSHDEDGETVLVLKALGAIYALQLQLLFLIGQQEDICAVQKEICAVQDGIRRLQFKEGDRLCEQLG